MNLGLHSVQPGPVLVDGHTIEKIYEYVKLPRHKHDQIKIVFFNQWPISGYIKHKIFYTYQFQMQL